MPLLVCFYPGNGGLCPWILIFLNGWVLGPLKRITIFFILLWFFENRWSLGDVLHCHIIFAASSFLTFLHHLVAILAFSLPPSSFSKIPRSQSPLLQPWPLYLFLYLYLNEDSSSVFTLAEPSVLNVIFLWPCIARKNYWKYNLKKSLILLWFEML